MEKVIKSLENSLDDTDYSVAMLNKEDEQLLLIEYNNTVVKYPSNKTLITLFEEQVTINPDNIALVYKNTQLTYRQFNEKANQLARYLQSKGIKEEVIVPICIEKSLEMFIGILGILKAGGAYVPIDPEFPEDRKKYIIEDTGANLVLTSLISLAKVPTSKAVNIVAVNGDWNDANNYPADNLSNIVLPHNLAYIIYTSGSTGMPKGVMVEHKSIYNYLLTSKAQFISENKSNSGSYINFAFTFDASLKSIFTPLVVGKLIVISSTQSAAVFEDPNLHKYAPYDFMQLTPSHLDFFYAELKDSPGKPLTLMLSIGGEALNAGHFDYLKGKNISINIINEYGPTETTVACTGYRFNTLDADKLPKRLPIGKPIPNVQIYILNEDNQLLPPGEVGEICVGGVQVARGYLNQDELTEKKFIANVFDASSDSSIYKTGDLGRWLPDGDIECLGRTDDQVKIRGYRIELGEIESTLISSNQVSKAAVVTIEDADGKKNLAAYVVPNGAFDKKGMISFLHGKLPPYMVPDIWVEMDQLPLSFNGKVDRKALPEPQITAGAADDDYSAPRNEYEQKTAEIWQRVLNLKQISIYDSFFDLGGHSVLALKVLKQVEKLTGKNLPVSTLFNYPTIEKFAVQLKDDSTINNNQSLIPLKVKGNKSPLYVVAGTNGTAFAFMHFANGLDADQPVFILQEPQKITELEEFPDSVEGIAKFYMDQILEQNPSGPYKLAGHCFGGVVAFEMSKQLEKQNKEVSLLLLFDAIAYETENMQPGLQRTLYLLKGAIEEILIKSYKNIRLFWYDSKLALKYRKYAIEQRSIKIKKIFHPEKHAEKYEFSDKVTELYKKAIRDYKITPYNKHVKLFRAKMGSIGIGERKFLNWKPYTASIELHEVEGDHLTMLDSKDFPPLIQQILDRAE